MNSRFVLPASLFSCCVCVVNVKRKALLLVLLCDIGTLHAKKVTELLHKQQHTQREKREAEQNRRILQKTCYGWEAYGKHVEAYGRIWEASGSVWKV